MKAFFFVFRQMLASLQRVNVSPFIKTQKRNLNLFSVFSESLKRQVKENKEFQQNVKQLEDSNRKLQDSEAMKRAKVAMEKSAKGTGRVVKGVATAVNTALETEAVKKTVETIGNVTEAVGQGINKVELDLIPGCRTYS